MLARTKIVGLYDNYIAGMADFRWLLEIEPLRKIRTRHAGNNHCCWIYSAEFEGRDRMRELRDCDPKRLQRQIGKAERAQWMFEQNLRLFRRNGWLPPGWSHFLANFFHAEFFEWHRAAERRPHAGVRAREFSVPCPTACRAPIGRPKACLTAERSRRAEDYRRRRFQPRAFRTAKADRRSRAENGSGISVIPSPLA